MVPVSAAQQALADAHVEVGKDSNALRTATVGYLRQNDAEFEIRIQLCTDLETMPVEDANQDWSQEESPYLPIARLRVPRQSDVSLSAYAPLLVRPDWTKPIPDSCGGLTQ